MTCDTPPCSPWTNTDAVRALPDASGIPDNPETDARLAELIDVATGSLFLASARLFPGVCEETVVPYPRPAAPAPSGYGYPAGGRVIGGGCRCTSRRAGCGCAGATSVGLGRCPVVEVTEVRLDGQVLDQDGNWRLDEERWLVRLPDENRRPRYFPCCPRDDLPSTEEGTFYVTLAWGADPPASGVLAAQVLTLHLALAENIGTGECKLPQRVTSYTRQGMQVSRSEPLSLLTDRKTGLWQVDLFLDTVNPTRAMGPAEVLVPGQAPEVSRPGW